MSLSITKPPLIEASEIPASLEANHLVAMQERTRMTCAVEDQILAEPSLNLTVAAIDRIIHSSDDTRPLIGPLSARGLCARAPSASVAPSPSAAMGPPRGPMARATQHPIE